VARCHSYIWNFTFLTLIFNNINLIKLIITKNCTFDIVSSWGKLSSFVLALCFCRNPTSSYGPGQAPLIDLHGLHVNEAIPILKQELSILRSTARETGERSQLLVCVGTGHHTKGSRTPARLPMAVEQFLLNQGFHFTQPQAGLLRVSIYWQLGFSCRWQG
jgi:hypothetical protein